jgi:hypothetical protein
MNKERPHVLVLPEDDANRQLANGFQLDHSLDTRRMQVLKAAGGWREVVNCFKKEHVPEMRRNANRFIVLLIDFDKRDERLAAIRAEIPNSLQERVFILGTWSEPEELRQQLGSPYEAIGLALAKDCRDNSEVTWAHPLLRHNSSELARLRQHVRSILFSAC